MGSLKGIWLPLKYTYYDLAYYICFSYSNQVVLKAQKYNTRCIIVGKTWSYLFPSWDRVYNFNCLILTWGTIIEHGWSVMGQEFQGPLKQPPNIFPGTSLDDDQQF